MLFHLGRPGHLYTQRNIYHNRIFDAAYGGVHHEGNAHRCVAYDSSCLSVEQPDTKSFALRHIASQAHIAILFAVVLTCLENSATLVVAESSYNVS